MERAAAVFEGRPDPGTVVGNANRYTFTVARVWKGAVGPTVDVYTSRHGAACGRRFDPTQSYLVYAYRLGEGELGDGICTRTRPSHSAGVDIGVLGAGRAVTEDRPVNVDAPAAEPPRIDPSPPPVPPAATGRRCAVAELPHDGIITALVVLLAVAGRRREPLV